MQLWKTLWFKRDSPALILVRWRYHACTDRSHRHQLLLLNQSISSSRGSLDPTCGISRLLDQYRSYKQSTHYLTSKVRTLLCTACNQRTLSMNSWSIITIFRNWWKQLNWSYCLSKPKMAKSGVIVRNSGTLQIFIRRSRDYQVTRSLTTAIITTIRVETEPSPPRSQDTTKLS